MGIKARQIHQKDADGLRWVSVSFLWTLDVDESLTGTPEVTEVGSADLTIANIGLNSTAMEINGEDVGINKAVRFTVDGGTDGTRYTLEVIGYSDSFPQQKIIGEILLDIT